jgi:uncharacterized protein (TIGR02145 family)
VPVSEGKASVTWSSNKTNGFALYTQAEWDKYTPGADLTTDAAPEPLLFLPAGGIRDYGDGSVGYTGSYGYYWSSVVSSSTDSYYMDFGSSNVVAYIEARAHGMSVRCVAE